MDTLHTLIANLFVLFIFGRRTAPRLATGSTGVVAGGSRETFI